VGQFKGGNADPHCDPGALLGDSGCGHGYCLHTTESIGVGMIAVSGSHRDLSGRQPNVKEFHTAKEVYA